MGTVIVAAIDYYLRNSIKKELKKDIRRKRNRDIRYFIEMYTNKIEKEELPIYWLLEKTIYYWGHLFIIHVLVPKWLRRGGIFR